VQHLGQPGKAFLLLVPRWSFAFKLDAFPEMQFLCFFCPWVLAPSSAQAALRSGAEHPAMPPWEPRSAEAAPPSPGTGGLALDVPSAGGVQHGACGAALPAGARRRCPGSACSRGAGPGQASRGLPVQQSSGLFRGCKALS